MDFEQVSTKKYYQIYTKFNEGDIVVLVTKYSSYLEKVLPMDYNHVPDMALKKGALYTKTLAVLPDDKNVIGGNLRIGTIGWSDAKDFRLATKSEIILYANTF